MITTTLRCNGCNETIETEETWANPLPDTWVSAEVDMRIGSSHRKILLIKTLHFCPRCMSSATIANVQDAFAHVIARNVGAITKKLEEKGKEEE